MAHQDAPLVTCLMPTRDRRSFLPRAIETFLAQDYDNRELLVLDDGADPIRDLVPADPRLRYERLEGPATVGAKRNIGCRGARGEIVVHWDDDDWSAPWRLSYQVAELLRTGADVCGLREVHYIEMTTRRAWRYVYPSAGARPWVAGGTMAYQRRFALAHPFPDIRAGEDTRFVWQGRPRIHVLEDPTFYVATVHPANTSPKHVGGSRWIEEDPASIAAIMDTSRRGALPAPQGRVRLESQRTAPSRASGQPVLAVPPRRGPVRTRSRTGIVREPVRTAVKSPRRRRSSSIRLGPTTPDQPPIVPSHVPVTVSVPVCGADDLLRRAVESVLSQTHRNLTVVVVNDGGDESPWELLDDLDDPRLVLFDLEKNSGRYFSDAVVLGATSDPYLVVQDSDDWSDPRRIELLLGAATARDAVAAVSLIELHGGTGRTDHAGARLVRPRLLSPPLGPRLYHRSDHHALFSTRVLRLIGGQYGGLRIGFDTLLMNLMLLVGEVAFVDEVLYHRTIRPGSLTTAASTGFGSPARAEAAAEVSRRYGVAFAAYRRFCRGETDRDRFLAALRELSIGSVPEHERSRLDQEVERLRATIAEARSRRQERPARPVVAGPRVVDVARIVQGSDLPWNGWSIKPSTAVELAARLEAVAPDSILEVGSGISTVVFAAYAARTGARVVTLEHSPTYATQTRRLLDRFGLRRTVEIKFAPLVATVATIHQPWYDVALDGSFDFAFIDGPPEQQGRVAALPAIRASLATEWEVWLHDGHRPHERGCIELWRRDFSFDARLYDVDDAGVWILRPPGTTAASPPPPSDVMVSILTGQRLGLLRRTLESLTRHEPTLLERVPVLVMVNGGDPVTESFVRSLPYVDEVLTGTAEMASEGVATSVLLKHVAESKARYVLHVEDDWVACTATHGWLDRARGMLEDDATVGQVRLRHRSERVLARHMITGRPIQWEERDGYMRSSSAHFTFNPSLMRVADVRRIFPAASELEAQRRFLDLRLASVQLTPGVFRHIGEGHSLRRQVYRPDARAVRSGKPE